MLTVYYVSAPEGFHLPYRTRVSVNSISLNKKNSKGIKYIFYSIKMVQYHSVTESTFLVHTVPSPR